MAVVVILLWFKKTHFKHLFLVWCEKYLSESRRIGKIFLWIMPMGYEKLIIPLIVGWTCKIHHESNIIIPYFSTDCTDVGSSCFIQRISIKNTDRNWSGHISCCLQLSQPESNMLEPEWYLYSHSHTRKDSLEIAVDYEACTQHFTQISTQK